MLLSYSSQVASCERAAPKEVALPALEGRCLVTCMATVVNCMVEGQHPGSLITRQVMPAVAAVVGLVTETSARLTPNLSIERTCSGTLRVPMHAAHVQR